MRIFLQIVFCNTFLLILDVKPENMFLDENDNIKLGDAGFACEIRQNPPNKISGTVSFMPPEQLHFGAYDGSVDVWALAVSLYFFLTYV